ncbi:hypothetical protein D3C78_1497510 [compost metagenome]
MRQLADGRGLARAVDAGNHHHQRLRAIQVEAALQRAQVVGQQLAQRRLHLGGVFDAFFLDPRTQRGQQLLGGLKARIGHNERRFEFLEQVFVDLDANENAANALPRARQALLQARQP